MRLQRCIQAGSTRCLDGLPVTPETDLLHISASNATVMFVTLPLHTSINLYLHPPNGLSFKFQNQSSTVVQSLLRSVSRDVNDLPAASVMRRSVPVIMQILLNLLEYAPFQFACTSELIAMRRDIKAKSDPKIIDQHKQAHQAALAKEGVK